MKNEHNVKGLLRVLTMHVIAGDFPVWRYSHEQSEAQLSGLSTEQREVWIRNFGSVRIEAAVGEGNNAVDTLRAIQQIVSDAREHITQTVPDFEISQTNLDRLNSTIASLTEKIKSSQSREELIEASTEKGKLEDQVLLMRIILELEGLGVEKVSRERIFSLAERGSKVLAKLNIPLAQLDIEQLGKVFSIQTGGAITAVESDDPIILLNVGIAPRETCQSWRGGIYNECLLAYVVDSNKKAINLSDEAGNIIGRSMIKLTDEKVLGESDETKSKTILVEPVYLISASDEAYRAFARILLEKANVMGITVTLPKGFDDRTLEIFGEEADRVNYSRPGGLVETREVYLPQSLNKYEYSDYLGGKISWFNHYVQTDAKVLRRIPS